LLIVRCRSRLTTAMTKDDADRIGVAKESVGAAIKALEASDDWNLGWEPLALLKEVKRLLDRTILAARPPARQASVVELSDRRRRPKK
jgi:hypothetical protein